MKQIFLYLFVFSFVINIFQYVSDSRILKQKEHEVEVLQKKIQKQEDTIQMLKKDIQKYEKLSIPNR